MSLYIIDKHAEVTDNILFGIIYSDPSLNSEKSSSLTNRYRLALNDFNKLFFSSYGIDYITEYFVSNGLDLRVVTHPFESNTCFEKAELLDFCDPLNVIKTLYFEYSLDSFLYAVVVPETGCFINKPRLKKLLNLPGNGFLKKAEALPENMSFGTCSPFITPNDLRINGGAVEKIIFDSETLEIKKHEKTLDDFSFGTNHRMSLQTNYYHCYEMLKSIYPGVVDKVEILSLSFKEKFVRTNGKICIQYEFNSINYSTAKFINSIHGYGDVSIINDYVDEIDLPNILTGEKYSRA
jgi:hypothetical protein